jgi:hypothetical protein
MKLLADLEVTTQAVERIAEAMGQDIAACEQKEIERALPLDSPILVGEPVAIFYEVPGGIPWRAGGEGAYRGRLFREEHPAHALPRVSPAGPVCGHGRYRSRMQKR